MAIIFFMVNIGTMLKGTGTTIEGITGGALSTNVTILIMTVLFVAYGLAGGLIAAAVTDVIQGVLIIVLSFILPPFAIMKIGGFGVLHDKLDASMFSLVAPHEVTLFFIFMVVINGLVGWVVQPHHMAICGSGKTEWESRVGMTYGNFIKRFCTSAWAFIGIFGAVLYPSLSPENRELVFGMATRDLLPAGLVGLMVAAMLAAVMSTCDAFMVDGSALFTRNFYERFINKKPGPKRSLLVARIASIFIVLGGIGFAFWIPNVVFGLKVLWQVTSVIGISFWLGMLWPKANRYGAWASFIVAAGISIFVGDMFRFSLGLPFQWTTAIYLPAGFLTNILVSLLTRGEPEQKIEQFYALMDTPVGKEHRLREKGYNIIYEGGAEPGQIEKDRKKETLKKPDQGLILAGLLKKGKRLTFTRYSEDLLGFMVAWGFVALVIFVTVAFTWIGA
jgi:Na+/proline symporter